MCNEREFISDYTPKDATQQSEFIEKYPEYDGRGILIAIIDDLIDVSLPGMQCTTTGLPKIYDCFDFCSGIEIDTSVVRETKKDRTLIGLSGRKLKLPLNWKNPSGKWHLGWKPLETLCPEETVFDKENNVTNMDEKRSKIFQSNTSLDEILPKTAVVDCIVWFNGEKWVTCLDFSFSKNLNNGEVLTNYRDCREYGLIFNKISYFVEICFNGNLLKFFTSFGDHGTIVAHVAAASFPDKPYRNGLAPGAQIVSMNFADSRGIYKKSVKNALLKCIEMKVDIINLSFEIMKKFNVSEILKKIVEKHGIIVLNAAGNEGPSYSTISNNYADFYGSSFIIGSVLTKEMEKNFYNKKEGYHGTIIFPYSSKGPLPNGESGVDFVAPGAAITDIPKWSSNKNEISYGTSMACPNAAGAIACLLSALKANSIQYSPKTIRLALSNTAFLPDGEDRLSFGNGLIQINSAFEFLKSFSKYISMKIPPKLSIYEPTKKDILKKGIYWIQNENDPTFKKFCVKLNFGRHVGTKWNSKLVSKTTETFIEYSKSVKQDMLFINISSNLLKPGSLNYAEIHGYGTSLNPSIGPIFHLPITVIIPQKMLKMKHIVKELVLNPLVPHHIFLCSPINSEQCNIKLTMLQKEVTAQIFLQHKIVQHVESTQSQLISNTLNFYPNLKTIVYSFSVQEQLTYGISIFIGMKKEKNFYNLALKVEIDFYFKKKRSICYKLHNKNILS